MDLIGTFYFDTGNNFNEGEKLNFSHKHEEDIFYIEVELPQNTNFVRFDPVEGYGCFLQNLNIYADTGISIGYQILNGVKSENDEIFFSTLDPQILINIKSYEVKKIKIQCTIKIMFNHKDLLHAQKNIESLHSQIEKMCSHIDLSRVKKYHSCSDLENFWLFFDAYDSISGREIRFCCEAIENNPTSKFYPTAEETVNEFIKLRNNMILESKLFSLLNEDRGGGVSKIYIGVCEMYSLPV